MVHFKITDGRVTRKFRVNSSETFDSLKKRIIDLFPGALENKEDFHLHYKDKDGDCITVSTDMEFQDFLSDLRDDSVWKLHIKELTTDDLSSSGNESQEDTGDTSHKSSDFCFHPSYMPLRMRRPTQRIASWGTPDPFKNDPFFSNSFPHFQPPRFDHHHFDREFENILEKHAEWLDSVHNTPPFVKEIPGEGGEGSTSKDRKEVRPKFVDDLATTFPGAQIKNFGSWEPREFQSLQRKGRVVGPVGYYVSWDSRNKAGDQEKNAKSKGSTK